MNTAKVFRTGRSQAVRLPKTYRFREREVAIRRIGDVVLLFPRRKAWTILEQSLAMFSGDFAADRNQPRRSDRRNPL